MIHRFVATLFVVCIIVATQNSCMQKKETQPAGPPGVTSKDELYVFLDSLEHRYEQACQQMGLANWNSYSKEAPYDLDAAKAGFATIFGDSATRAIIQEWLRRSPSLADKPLTRRLNLWQRSFLGGAVYADAGIARRENALQKVITDFGFTFQNAPTTRAKVSSLMRQERKQGVRHKLWSVTSQLSALAQDSLLNLVHLRNAKAVALGFPNYYSLSLHLHAIDEAWLLKTLTSLEEKTRAEFEKFILSSKKKLRIKEFGPWDFDYALREGVSLPDKYFPPESVFATIHTFEKGIGFPVDSLPIKEVVKDIPYGGLSLAITIPSDCRFLVNPTKGKGFYSTAFHEYGHALKAVLTDVGHPILKGYEWIPGAQCAAYEEGVADLHGEFTEDSLWLSTFTKAKPKEIERYLKGRHLPALYRMRNLMKNFFIEYEMYKNPEQDMAEVERAMYKKYLLVDLDSTEAHQYASSIWYTSYPCYYQNYILAGMIATQLQEALTSRFGDKKTTDSTVASWLTKSLYADGETREWNMRIRDACGKSLETGAYLRKLGIETARVITKEE